VECVGDRLRLRPWVGVEASNAHHTRVREPELRASAEQHWCAGGQRTTGEGPKPCGSGPSYCCTNAARSSRGCCDDRRAHQMRSVVTDWRNAHKRW